MLVAGVEWEPVEISGHVVSWRLVEPDHLDILHTVVVINSILTVVNNMVIVIIHLDILHTDIFINMY